MSQEEEEFSHLVTKLGLSRDPFPVEAPEKIDYWADNKKLLKKLIGIQIDSTFSDSSEIFVYWGELGSGKTHAYRYLSSEKVMGSILGKVGRTEPPNVVHIAVTAPIPRRTGELTFYVYRNIFERLIPHFTRDHLGALADLLEGEENIVPYEPLRRLVSKVATQMTLIERGLQRRITEQEEYRFFLGQRHKEFGVLGLQADQASVLTCLMKALLPTTDRIILWLDELENLAEATAAERRLFSDFMRKIYDNMDRRLTIVLIFTEQSVDHVRTLLMPAVEDRVGGPDKYVHFEPMKEMDDLIEYFKTNIQLAGGNVSFIEEDALELLVEKLLEKRGKAGIFPRRFNADIRRWLLRLFLSWRGKKEKGDFVITKKLVSQLEEDKERLIEEVSEELLR